MKFWLKFEAFLNKIIVSITHAISAFTYKITPNKIKKSIEESQNSADKWKKSSQETIDRSLKAAKTNASKVVVNTKDTINSSKKKVQQTIVSTKSYDWKSLNGKKIAIIFTALLSPLLLKLKGWALSLSPQMIITVTISSAVISLTGISIIQEASKIKDKIDEGVVREPASYTDSMPVDAWKKSEYHNQSEKIVKLGEVSIPIYIENRRGMQSVLIDFSFLATNRYIAKYFAIYENEYRLRDRLNRKLQPIIPSFPMERDGKKILKDKIIIEINSLLKDLKIKGEIKDIYIHSLLNG